MKRAIPLLIVLLTPVLAATSLWQYFVIRNQAAQIAALEQGKAAISAKQEHDEKAQKDLTQRNAMLAKESDTLRSKLETEETAAAPAPSATPVKKKESPLASYMKMLKDPKMRDMIRSQQRFAMPMLYSDLVKQLGLSAEDANKLYDLLSDEQMAQMNKGLSAMGQNLDDSTQTEDQAKSALKDFLGADGYQQYETYQKTAADRMVLNQFSQGLSGQNALSDSQRNALLQIMSDTRAQVPSSVLDSSNNASMDQKVAAMNDPKQVDGFLQQQQKLNEQVIAKAGPILNPEQLTALKNYQAQMLKMMQMGIQMRKGMSDSQNTSTGN